MAKFLLVLKIPNDDDSTLIERSLDWSNDIRIGDGLTIFARDGKETYRVQCKVTDIVHYIDLKYTKVHIEPVEGQDLVFLRENLLFHGDEKWYEPP